MATLASQRRLREDGEAAVLEALRLGGPLTRRDLAERTGLGRTTVFEIVRDLVGRATLVETAVEQANPGPGRPTTLVALNPRFPLVAGVELARRHARVLLLNAAHEQIAYIVEEGGFRDDPQAPGRLLALLRRAAEAGGAQFGQIKHVGLGWGGLVDALVPSNEIVQLEHRLKAERGISLRVANNSHLAALAESTWGLARGHSQVLYVHWSSGVGSGWVSKGALLSGAHGAAGEIGHVSIDPVAGRPCYCGSRGCLEMYAGLEALTAECREAGLAVANEHALIAAVRQGDPVVRRIVGEAARRLGRVVAGAAVLLDPDIVVLGGEMASLGEIAVEPLRIALAENVTPRMPRRLEVASSLMGEAAVVRGAIALVLPQVNFATG
jgi:predicted NBD/HSP70 family sugar kinase